MLQRKIRLRQKSEYKRVFSSGKSYVGKYAVIYVLSGPPKFGFIASKKIGNSVQRNRAKRLMREFIRLNLDNFEQDKQIILIARSRIRGVSYFEVEKSLWQIFDKAKLIKLKK